MVNLTIIYVYLDITFTGTNWIDFHSPFMGLLMRLQSSFVTDQPFAVSTFSFHRFLCSLSRVQLLHNDYDESKII